MNINDVVIRLNSIGSKIDKLPAAMQGDLLLELDLFTDFFRDKCLRSVHRRQEVEGKKIGGSYLTC